MQFDSYSSLKTAIAKYLHRSDLTDQLGGFISLAESEMARMLRPWTLEAISTITLIATQDTYAMPARTKEVKSVHLTGTKATELLKYSPAQINDLYAQQDAGTPRHYALEGSNIVVKPTPSEAGTLELLLIRTSAPLNDVDATNTVLQTYPDLYLFGALKYAFVYLRNTNQATLANETFMSGIEEANRESRKYKASGVPAGRRHIGRARIV